MKKTNRLLSCALSVLMLLSSLASCTFPSPAPAVLSGSESPAGDGGTAAASENTLDLEAAGVSFDLTGEMQDLKGTLQPSYGFEVEEGSGLWLSGLTYCAMTKEKYDELVQKGAGLSDEDIEFIAPRLIDFFVVYTIDGGRTLEDLRELLEAYGLPAEGCREIGSAGEYRFFSLIDPLADMLDTEFVFDEGFREEYESLLKMCEDPSWIRTYEPKPVGAAGAEVVFETFDLKGNAVSSKELFGENRLTMVNLWGTYCGPCLSEMPDLEKLNERLKEKGCAVVGIVIDVAGIGDTVMLGTAEEILADTGVTYLNLLPWIGMENALPSAFIPTSYFIDSDGRIVGEAAVGARGADDYEAIIDALLSEMN